MGDYHVHLHPHGPYSGSGPKPGEDLGGHIESYVERALAIGVDHIAFTEHLYRCVESIPVLGSFWEEAPSHLISATAAWIEEDRWLSLDAYVDAVLRAKDAGLPVRLGLEVDYFPQTIDAIVEFLDPYPWDVLIGSVHWVRGWSIDHEDFTAEFDRRGVDVAYADYFAVETELAWSGAVDVLAHVDVVKKFGYTLDAPPVDLYAPVVAAAAASGTAIEVSTAGLRNPANEIYPHPTLLGMFYDGGVPITLASDAHEAGQVGDRFADAIAAARLAGYTERVVFEKRQPSVVPLV